MTGSFLGLAGVRDTQPTILGCVRASRGVEEGGGFLGRHVSVCGGKTAYVSASANFALNFAPGPYGLNVTRLSGLDLYILQTGSMVPHNLATVISCANLAKLVSCPNLAKT